MCEIVRTDLMQLTISPSSLLHLISVPFFVDIDYCAGDANPRVAPCVTANIKPGPEGCVEWVDPEKGIEAVNCTCKHYGINGTTCHNGNYVVLLSFLAHLVC